MFKKIALLVAIAFTTFSLSAQTKWVTDNVHSSVKFTVTHMAISEVEGSFKKFEGSFTSSKPDFTDAKISFTVDTKSINTDNDMRDNDLKSEKFFYVEKFPTMKFVSSSMKSLGGNKYELTGNLTIRDVTRQVKFNVNYGGSAKDYQGNMKAGFKAFTVINRNDYNVSGGAAMVGSDVNITLNLEFIQQK